MITISKDFQGWPVYAKNLKEILLELGFEEKDGKYFNKKPILRFATYRIFG